MGFTLTGNVDVVLVQQLVTSEPPDICSFTANYGAQRHALVFVGCDLFVVVFVHKLGWRLCSKKNPRSFKRFEIKLQFHLCSVYKRTLNFNDGYQLVISGITNVFSRVRWLESRDNELPDNVTAEDFDPRIWFQYISVP